MPQFFQATILEVGCMHGSSLIISHCDWSTQSYIISKRLNNFSPMVGRPKQWIFTLTSIMLLRVLWFCHWDGPHALWEGIQGGMSCQIPCSSSRSSSDFCFFARQTLLHAFAKCLLSYELHLHPSSQSEVRQGFCGVLKVILIFHP